MFVTVQGYVTINDLMLNSSVNLVVQQYTTLLMIFIFDLNLLKTALSYSMFIAINLSPSFFCCTVTIY